MSAIEVKVIFKICDLQKNLIFLLCVYLFILIANKFNDLLFIDGDLSMKVRLMFTYIDVHVIYSSMSDKLNFPLIKQCASRKKNMFNPLPLVDAPFNMSL